MIINTNISALNAWRNVTQTDNSLSKSLERLSSGFRINRAADDAAGLAISEKMRGQVSGLNQAVRNSQDAISLIQTGEGALNESTSIAQRIRELADQAASDTNTLSDRYQIQQEVNQLSGEVTRISGSTEFNTKKLLDGTFNGTFQIGANAGQTISVKIGAMDAKTLGMTNISDKLVVDSGSTTIDSASATNAMTNLASNIFTVKFYTDATTATQINADLVAANGVSLATVTGVSATASDLSFAVTNTTYLQAGQTAGTLTVRVGANVQTGTSATVAALAGGDGISVLSQADAGNALNKLDSATNQISSQRAQLGAVQNRLEHTIANLSVASENLTAAESRIRDVDMAAEMSVFTRNQILMQAGTAMLAQANQKPQAVLQLLR
ncbi:MAG: flagellin N-terminal helical domain-containing protein [Symbiobacteriia bacterium]